MKQIDWMKSAGVGVAVAVIAACSSLNTKVGGVFKLDTDLKLAFKAEADINPDDKKRPSPLFLRMYELKSTKQFEKANFIDLFERDKEVLGADLVAKQTLKRLRPGDERTDRFVLKPDTRYVGLFAEFLQYKDAKFKILVPVSPTNVVASSAEVYVAGNTIRNPRESDK
jgi:type VI secretion system protein VasD